MLFCCRLGNGFEINAEFSEKKRERPCLACLRCRTSSSNELKEAGVALARTYSGGEKAIDCPCP